MMKDDDIVVRARGRLGAGADAAFETFYRERSLPMVRLAVLLVDRRAVADEIVQESMAAVFARWGQLDEPAAYLRTVVVNRCRDELRRRRNRREVELAERVDHPAPGDELRDVIASLPERQRTVVVLRFYVDLSIEEIATMTGFPSGTVKSTLHRALARLRTVVER